MYFRDKFDNITTLLLLNQSPQGCKIQLGDKTNPFWKFEQTGLYDQKDSNLTAQPLVMFNTLQSTNVEDRVIQDEIILCKDNSQTILTAYKDENKKDLEDNYVCDFGVPSTADFITEEEQLENEYL